MPRLDLADITAVLLPDGWHDIQPGTIDLTDQGGVQLHHGGAWTPGSVMVADRTITFTNGTGQRITAASAAVIAVRHN